jgi:cell division inhibitor SulA
VKVKTGGMIFVLAWTLWIRTQTPTTDTWNAAPGLPSQEKCAASIKEKLETWRQFKDAVFTGNNSTMVYICLPESEDPRKAPHEPTKPQK